MRTRTRRILAPAVVLLGALATAPGAAAATTQELIATFDEAPAGTAVQAFASNGAAPVTTSVVTFGAGQAIAAARGADPAAPRTAVRLPAFDPGATAPRAVLSVVNSGAADAFSPGKRDFAWAADFALDEVTTSAAPGSTDNGDNLVQRGLAGQGRQFKLQLDRHQVSCSLEGTAGKQHVMVPVTVRPQVWYRALCQRQGPRLVATLSEYDATGAVAHTWSATGYRAGGVGSVAWSNRLVPVSVGGKLNNNGSLVLNAADQFNGSVDQVVIDIVG